MSELTEAQQKKRKVLLKAVDEAVAYAAQKIPELGNTTPQGLCDQIGIMKQAKKDIEKAEKIMVERFKSMIGDQLEVRGDGYVAKITIAERNALDQGEAKRLLEEAGIPIPMSATEVSTLRVDPI